MEEGFLAPPFDLAAMVVFGKQERELLWLGSWEREERMTRFFSRCQLYGTRRTERLRFYSRLLFKLTPKAMQKA